MTTAAAQQQKPWIWTPNRVEAALLLADDRLTNQEIAKRCGVHRATLHRWLQHPEFAQRVAQQRQEYDRVFTETMRQAIADRYRRMADEAEAQRQARSAARRRR